MEFELSEDCDIHELAACQGGLWRANAVVLARHYPTRADLEDLAAALARTPYRGDRGRDLGTVLTRVVRRGYGDCEDLASAWHTVLKALLGRTADVQSLLTPGGKPGQYHAFCRVHGQVFDPSVAGNRVLRFATVGGMGAPPSSIYWDPRAVVIDA